MIMIPTTHSEEETVSSSYEENDDQLFVQINEWLQQKVNIVVILYNVHICCVIGHCIQIQCCSFSVILRLILLRVFIMGEKQNGQEWNLSIFNFQPPKLFLDTLFFQ